MESTVHIAALAAKLAPRGLDLVHPFALGWVNKDLPAEQRLAGGDDQLGILIGNTRALWAPFVAAVRAGGALAAAADPIDRYCEAVLGAALDEAGVVAAVRWGHEPAPRLAIQRIAALAGLAPQSAVGLNVHPTYGPWFALRAVLVVDESGPSGAPPAVASPCVDCARTCGPAFERAQAAQATRQGISETWPLWLEVRESCPVGRQWRYPEPMIRWHYARDRSALG